LFVFFEGVLCGVVWRSIKLGRPLGIVLYPWFAFCILFWFGMNSLLENKLLPLVLDVIGLSLYELLCLRRENPVVVFAGPSLNRAHQTGLGDCPI
jgi:hypothetical protein